VAARFPETLTGQATCGHNPVRLVTLVTASSSTASAGCDRVAARVCRPGCPPAGRDCQSRKAGWFHASRSNHRPAREAVPGPGR
jgi:hypothetical protein